MRFSPARAAIGDTLRALAPARTGGAQGRVREMSIPSIAKPLVARRVARARVALVVAVLALGVAAGAPAPAADKPAGEPVRWDQQRVTKMAVELADAVREAREAVRRSPMSQNIGQRTTYYELLETMRLVDNTARHLKKRLQAGEGADETRATFERINSLRQDAEEQGRRALIEAPVIDALVKAGSLHNQMKPYYYGKN